MGNPLDMKPNKLPLSQADILNCLEYKNGALIWKNKKANLARLNGKEAGVIHRSGYRFIKFGNQMYPAHRIVWVYHNGGIDDNLQIDHVNGIKNDNCIENLRLVTAQQNCFNRSRLKAKGYTWNKAMNKWQASIFVSGKNKFLGLFANEKDARNVYLDNCKIYHKGLSV